MKIEIENIKTMDINEKQCGEDNRGVKIRNATDKEYSQVIVLIVEELGQSGFLADVTLKK